MHDLLFVELITRKIHRKRRIKNGYTSCKGINSLALFLPFHMYAAILFK